MAADRIRLAIGKGVENAKVLCHFSVRVGETAGTASARQAQASLAAVEQLLSSPNIRLHPDTLR